VTGTPGTPALRVRGLCKRFGAQTVLDDVSLEVPAGTVHALLGPNGAGKTTTVQVLATLLRADAGSVEVFGHDVRTEPDAVRALIGLTGQFAAVDGLLTGVENLRLMARLHHLGRRDRESRVAELLERFGLTEVARKPLAVWSGGLRRRLDLAMTLVGSPRLLVLDEPTTGLDPRSRRDLWDLVRELVAEGTTVLLTTQYLEEADALADRVAVLDRGRLVASGTPVELKRRVPGGHLVLRFPGAAELAAAAGVLAVSDPGAGLELRVPADHDEVRAVRETLARLDAASIPLAGLAIRTPDLDDVFLAVTRRGTVQEVS
jgi:ABC-2 type transport system ATP-binding protein